MKYGFLLVALLVTSNAGASEMDAKIKHCTTLSSFAKSLMQVRQSGAASLADLLKDEGGDSPAQKIMRSLILKAFNHPRYETEENQQKEAEDFGNEVMSKCMADDPEYAY